MAFWRLKYSAFANPNPSSTICFLSTFMIRAYSTSFLITKTPKSQKNKRKKKESARTKHIHHESERIPHFENILRHDNHFRFFLKTKDYLSKQPQQVLRLDDAGKLYRELGFPRGRKVLKFIQSHPLVFQTYHHSNDKIWFGFTDFMETFLEEEKRIMDEMEKERIETGREFSIVTWDQKLAVSVLEREFMIDEDGAKKAFQFKVKHGKLLNLGENDERKLNLLNTLPLVSPYTGGSRLDLWTLEAEKYRVGVVHEFLSLTLEKRASIHHIVEFKEELSLTKHTYAMLLKQARSFYLAGTEMNWVVFLKDAYGEDGVLVHKDPQVVFNEKLFEFADKQKLEIN
ncbi:hypothetical protein L1987_22694 [Smallanthus sonchifolius]|uniref:Uncharacterized protein n=1 Tax=Smallanthus sonchifolius TaxID=185202 RepID=A0ACB9IFR8_9ASTR|nr:hypothetical protein L1987_22694 [Smallanthus sonchifolius]